MLMLLFAVTTFAQSAPEAGSIYRIKHVASNLYFTTADFTKTGGEGAFKLQSEVEDPSQLFTLVPSETAGQYYLKQTKDETEYYVKAASWNFFASTTDKTSFTISLVDGETSVYTLNQTQQGANHGAAGVDNTAEGSSIYCNKSGENAKWSFEYVGKEFSTVTVKYNLTYNGETKFVQNADVEDGAEYPAPTLPDYLSAEKPVGNVNAADAIDGVITVNVPLTVEELPFVAAETVEGISNWYYMQMHWNNKHYVAANGTAIEWKETAVPEDNKDAYTWGFVGNIFDGFKVVNYAAYDASEEAYTLTFANGATSLAAFDAATQFPLVHTGWSAASAESFCLSIPNTANYLNAQGTSVASWSDADAGSTFTLTERPMTLNAELEALIAEYEAISFPVGANPGEYSEATVATFNAALEAAKAVENAQQSDIDALVAAYNNMAANPVVAGTYMIVSAASAFGENTKAISCYTYDTYYSAHRTPAWAPIDENDPLQYWTLEDAGEGKFNIKATYEGNYITTATSMSATATAASFESLGSAQFKIDLGGKLHCNGWNWGGAGVSGPLTTWDDVKDSPSAWKLVKVEAPSFTHSLTVGEVGYATLMLAFNATIPAGAECYYAAEAIDAEGILNLTQVAGTVLPAKTPVIVKAAAGEYAFASTDATATVEGNLLSGTLYTKNVTPAGTAYVLSAPEGVVGLYQAQLTDAGTFQNNANKAYLVVESGNAAPSYSFNFDWAGTTGIEGVVAEGAQDGAIYDITGRRVKAITAPGIYIVNGKKVVK